VLGEVPLALTHFIGQTAVAAITDVATVWSIFVRLLDRGNDRRTQAADQW
jgi:hypothetical protein